MVDRECHDAHALALRLAHLHRRDVDARLAHDGADRADDAGAVDVRTDEETCVRVNIHTESVDPYNASLRTEERALYLCRARFCRPRPRRDTHGDER